MTKIDHWKGRLTELGGWPRLLDEVNFFGNTGFPKKFNHPKIFKSLRPEQNSFLLVDEDSLCIICDYDTCEPGSRYFKIKNNLGIKFGTRCIYALNENILSNDPSTEVKNNLELSLYNLDGVLVERYLSEPLSFSKLYRGSCSFVVLEERLYVSFYAQKSNGLVCACFELDNELDSLIITNEWKSVRVLDAVGGDLYFLRNESEIVRLSTDLIFVFTYNLEYSEFVRFHGRKGSYLYFSLRTKRRRELLCINTSNWTKLCSVDAKGPYRYIKLIGNKREPVPGFEDVLDFHYLSDTDVVLTYEKSLWWYDTRTFVRLDDSEDQFIEAFSDGNTIFIFSERSLKRIKLSENEVKPLSSYKFPEQIEDFCTHPYILMRNISLLIQRMIPTSKNHISNVLRAAVSIYRFEAKGRIFLSAEENHYYFLTTSDRKDVMDNESFYPNYVILEWNSKTAKTRKLENTETGVLPPYTNLVAIHSKDSYSKFSLIYYTYKLDSNGDYDGRLFKWDLKKKKLERFDAPEKVQWEDPRNEDYYSIQDYNEEYILQAKRKRVSPKEYYLFIRLIHLKDLSLIEYDTGILHSYGERDSSVFSDMCLCSAKVIAIVNRKKSCVEIIDLQSGKKLQYSLEHDFYYLMYDSVKNFLILHTDDTIIYYSLNDSSLLARLLIFNEDEFMFSSYVDSRFFFSPKPDLTTYVINQLIKDELDEQEKKEYIEEFNNWKHFDELLFTGQEPNNLGIIGLGNDYPSLPILE